MIRVCLKSPCLSLKLIFLLFSLSAFASESSPRFLVHLLDYLAQDYSGAVSHGKVVSQTEYKEQLEFSQTAIEINQNLVETKFNPQIHEQLKALQSLIVQKSDAQKVASLARTIQSEVIKLSGLSVSPSQWPNLKNGNIIFSQNCVSCHGQQGQGDGPVAATLSPKPANLLDHNKMDSLSPFQVFNAVRVGVPGTAMIAFPKLSDQEVWDLAFYVISLRHAPPDQQRGDAQNELTSELLKKLATESDEQLKKENLNISQLRHLSLEDQTLNFIMLAKDNLEMAFKDYQSQDFNSARKKALIAYLDGIEPIEPKLKARDPQITLILEQKMAEVRAAIESQKPSSYIAGTIKNANEVLWHVQQILQNQTSSPWITFTVAAGILLREGFEAVLLIIALLGVAHAAHLSEIASPIAKKVARKAKNWIHGGWIVAVGCGLITWFFSGWIMGMSGASRELMEGCTSIFAVLVLLYLGFWLHSKTEIHRWKIFIDARVRSAIDDKNMIGLALISFIAVFREAFETVLFLRAVWLEGGAQSKIALMAGVASAFIFVLFLAWLLLRYSTKIPIRKIFDISSVLMVALAVILVGKGLHSLQESGVLSITVMPLSIHASEFVGFYPTFETILSQLIVFGLSVVLWMYGKRPSFKSRVA